MLRWTFRILVGVFALFGVLVAATAAWLWLSARPVLEEARAIYERIPSEAHCEGPRGRPPGYPASVREVESVQAAETAVYDAACEDAGLTRSCAYFTGAVRSFGFKAYRRLYLNDCELRAVSLHGDTRLRHALELLYPDRPVAELGEHEMTCVAHVMRRGSQRFCDDHPECCPAAQEAAP